MRPCARRNGRARIASSRPKAHCRPPLGSDGRFPPSSRSATIVIGMRAFRLSLFLASAAGALSAAAYLWTPLVSPEVPKLHLAAPSIRSSVLEPPLRIPPLSLHVATVRHLLPARVVGTALVRLPHVAPQLVAR